MLRSKINRNFKDENRFTILIKRVILISNFSCIENMYFGKYREAAWCHYGHYNGTQKIIYTRDHNLVHSSYGLLHKHPRRPELWTWQVWTKLFQSWGPFLKNMYLTLCQFLKKSHPIRPVEGLKLCLDFLCNAGIK